MLGFKGPQVLDSIAGTAGANAPLYDALQPELRLLRQEKLWSVANGGLGSLSLNTFFAMSLNVYNPPGSGMLTVVEGVQLSITPTVAHPQLVYQVSNWIIIPAVGLAGHTPANFRDQRANGGPVIQGRANTQCLPIADTPTNGGGLLYLAVGSVVANSTFAFEDFTTWVIPPGYGLRFDLMQNSAAFVAGDTGSGSAFGTERVADASELQAGGH